MASRGRTQTLPGDTQGVHTRANGAEGTADAVPGAAVTPAAARLVPSATPVRPAGRGDGAHAPPPCLPPRPLWALPQAVHRPCHPQDVPPRAGHLQHRAGASEWTEDSRSGGRSPPAPPTPQPTPACSSAPSRTSACVKRHDTDRLGPGGGHALTVPACEQTLGRPHDGPPPPPSPRPAPRGCWKASLHRSDPSHCKTCGSVRLRAGHGDSLTGEPPLLGDGCSRLGGTAPAQGLRVAQVSRGPSRRTSQDSPVTAASGEHLRAVTRALSGDGGRSHGSQNPSEISVFSRIH